MEKGSDVVPLKLIHYTIAGATSGVCSRIAGQPLDVLKIRFQVQIPKDGKLKYTGIIASTRTIFKEEGLTAFWKGHVPAQVLSVAFNSVKFSTYEICQDYFSKHFPQHKNHVYSVSVVDFMCGGIAGVLSTCICYPMDTLRTRLIAQSSQMEVYSGVFHAVTLMMKENGLRTFYKGIIPTMCMIFPNTGLHFGFYGTFKSLWRLCMPSQCDSDSKKMMRLICGSMSGLCSKLTLLPLDGVKKRLQVQGLHGFKQEYKGMLHCFRVVINKEGVMALYRGGTPSILKATVTAGITFLTYEQSCDFLRWYQRSNTH